MMTDLTVMLCVASFIAGVWLSRTIFARLNPLCIGSFVSKDGTTIYYGYRTGKEALDLIDLIISERDNDVLEQSGQKS